MRRDRNRITGNERDTLRVDRSDLRTRKPITTFELWIVSVLDARGAALYGELVKSVSDRMYVEAIRQGAAVLDIGLFGAKLFYAEAAAILERGDGVYWAIRGRSMTPDIGSRGLRAELSPIQSRAF